MKKKIYEPPCCTLVQVVLEEGMCQSSGQDISEVNIKSSNPIEVNKYNAIGDENGFNDIGFE